MNVADSNRDPLNARAASTWERAAAACVLGLTVAASATFAYALLFSQFMGWDDEGYFLLGLRAYQQGRGLYERIETIYGPFYFQAVAGLSSLLHVPLDNIGARWFVFSVWMLSCLCVYRYVRRVTGSALAALLAYVLAFPILLVLGNEPLHPGGLIVLLLSALVLVSRGLEIETRRTAVLAVCGALTGAIALTKLNVGVFTVIACAVLFVRAAPRNRMGEALRIGAAVLVPLFPVCLMLPLLGRDEFRGFALFVALSLVPFGFLPPLESDARALRRVLAYCLGGATVTLVVLGVCLLGGTGLNALWHSLVTDSLRFVGVYVYPPRNESSVLLAAGAAVPVCVGALLRWTTWLEGNSRTLLKLAAGLVVLVLCLFPPYTPMLALPLVWIVALPGTSARSGIRTRTLLALLVVMHSLHAYPVAGSQVGFFSYLVPAVGVIIVCDAFGDLPPSWRAAASRPRWKIAGIGAVLAILATCHTASTIPRPLWTQFAEGVPLELCGAESIRLAERRTAALQWVTQNLEHNADTFIGMPGVHSFYGWTALPPPVPFYPHTWILFPDDAKQEKLLHALQASKRPCIVRNRQLVDFWMPDKTPRPGPLVRAADHAFRAAGRVGYYELLFPLAAHPDLVLSAFPVEVPREMLESHHAATAIRLAFPVMPGVRVARLVARDLSNGVDVFDTAAAAPAQRATIVSMDGSATFCGDPLVPIDLSRRTDVLMLCPPTSVPVTPRSGIVRAYDAEGRIVARLVMPEDVGDH